jgi:hypothetical protein
MLSVSLDERVLLHVHALSDAARYTLPIPFVDDTNRCPAWMGTS